VKEGKVQGWRLLKDSLARRSMFILTLVPGLIDLGIASTSTGFLDLGS